MILEIRDLSCRYVSRRKDTLSHVDLSLAEGEMVLIAGRSGCGKSTLIKSITGLLEPGEARLTGTISLDGRDVREMSAEDIGLLAGTVYQTPDDQLFAMTVADEVGFALENRGEDPSVIREEVRRALAKTGLSGMEARSIHALSGGQRQRLALASILVTHPKLLILDEPVSQMNPKGVKDFLELLVSLNREDHMTILVVEHRVNELARYFPRLCCMYEGRFIYDGATEGAWTALGDTEAYGLREPQAVKLGRLLHLPYLSGHVKETAEEIRKSGISFAPHILREKKESHAPVVLEGRDLHYRYQGAEKETLHGLSFAIRKGTINALMGFNGAGKSTLMNLLSGLDTPTSGEILLLGKPAEKQRHHIGYMRQEADLMLLTDSVIDELTWNNKTITEEELDRLLRRLHVRHYCHDFPLALSKGQRLRVVFGAMLARKDNDLLLLDEPTTGQDQKSLSDIKALLLYAASEGRTIFFCTHDIELAGELADQVFLLKEGRFLASGTPHAIFSDKKLMEEGGLALPPMLALSEMLGIEPCISVKEVMDHVL